ncbi:MAG: helicase [Clostridiaceae bacterium]|nr:helicase [Clostridiaceae bacterium]
MRYREFIERKKITTTATGFKSSQLNPMLFDFQKDIVRWACKKGRAAIFADCGLGKTPMQLEWARQVIQHTGGKVLILAPLAVSKQTQREGEKFGIKVNLAKEQADVVDGINITNYEMLHKFTAKEFTGIVLDESSILKSYTGKVRNQIIDSFRHTPYKLACTATPAPNDHMELGNHAEFVGAMSRTEMLSTFFVHDGGNTSQWRLKGHAEDEFWKWVSSWAVVIRKPSDLGYKDGKFQLPELKIKPVLVNTEIDYSMPLIAGTLSERRKARRDSLEERVEVTAKMANKSKEQFLVWCDFNYESEALTKAIPDAVEIKGANSKEHKENAMIDFANGDIRVLVTKPSIAGFGMNWQNCHNEIFCGLSDSYEQFYQAIRRCWRFGQDKSVNISVVMSNREISTLNNIQRKEKDAEVMQDNMVKHTRKILSKDIKATTLKTTKYIPRAKMRIPEWLRSETA